MNNIDTLQAILGGSKPNGTLLVRTKHGSPHVDLFGATNIGCIIPLEKIEDFIEQLVVTCADYHTLYQINIGSDGEVMEIPGCKLQKIIMYLRQARDIGVMLGEYNQFF